MEFIAGDVERGHFGVADFGAFGVGVFVEFATDRETGFRLRRRDQFDDCRSTGQVSTPESYCSGWPVRKCSRDASKKAPDIRGLFACRCFF